MRWRSWPQNLFLNPDKIATAMLPNFMIIGVEKGGTTSLYHYLKQHSDIYFPEVKEPNFFSVGRGISIQQEYEALYDDADTQTAIGDASVSYFHDPTAAQRIKALIPDCRFLLILRDPVDRAFSHYHMLIQQRAIPKRPFREALVEAEASGSYLNTGIPNSRYADSIESYFRCFGSDAFNIHRYADYKANNTGTIKNILHFLGVSEQVKAETAKKYNTSRVYRNRHIHELVYGKGSLKSLAKRLIPTRAQIWIREAIQKINSEPPPVCTEEERHMALRVLRDDIDRTEELLSWDLSEWKTGGGN